jgi:hypothetical protein
MFLADLFFSPRRLVPLQQSGIVPMASSTLLAVGARSAELPSFVPSGSPQSGRRDAIWPQRERLHSESARERFTCPCCQAWTLEVNNGANKNFPAVNGDDIRR